MSITFISFSTVINTNGIRLANTIDVFLKHCFYSVSGACVSEHIGKRYKSHDIYCIKGF